MVGQPIYNSKKSNKMLFHQLVCTESFLTFCTYIPQTFPNCDAFTFYEESNGCFAWETCVDFNAESCSDCISGDASCEAAVRVRVITLFLNKPPLKTFVDLYFNMKKMSKEAASSSEIES